MNYLVLSRLILPMVFVFPCLCARQPHIIMIVADDLGWNDVSFHGSKQIPTPNIDKLAGDGIILDNYYVLPICSPTRSAFMTGRYPIHTGMQTSTIFAPNTWAVGLNETFLPQYLKKQGYKTHAIGKWHLGFYARNFTPTERGFDSFYGYYLGKSDYWDHSDLETFWGLDLHNNEQPVFNQWGNYSTEMYTAEAENLIQHHNTSQPLFLYLAYQAVHSANTPMDPLQAPEGWINKYKYIKHKQRRKYAAMLGYMDYCIGRVYDALAAKGMLENAIIVFTTDNGGPANGFDWNWANNFPLRGVKRTLFEGGVRGAGFISSKLLKNPGRVSMDLMHATDWLPTFVNLAGGSIDSNSLDGVDQWNTLQNMTPSPRKEILLNIDDQLYHNAAIRSGDWKLVRETTSWDGWYPPPQSEEEEKESFDFSQGSFPTCGKVPSNVTHCRKDQGYCLFNIAEDPCEYDDVSQQYPGILKSLIARLDYYRSTMVPPKINRTVDPLSNPKLHDGVWQPWIKLV